MNRREQALNVGDVIGGCRILDFLGQGGMGQVYLAEHLRLVKRVAIKILPPDIAYQEYIERFFREARMAARIDHPNVATIHDVGDEDGVYYIVMQYVRGKNLAELLDAQGGPLPWRSAVRLVQLACQGLDAVHAEGLVHRDVKPSNIMLSSDPREPRVFLMDFGLVREEIDPNLSHAGVLVGTPPYMSPEQCSGRPLDRRSDIFSMGSTLYCLLTGRAPYQGNDARDVAGKIVSGQRPPRVDLVNSDVPGELALLLEKAMAQAPELRFATAAAMARELKALLRGPLGKAPPVRPPSYTPVPGNTLPEPQAAPPIVVPPLTVWEVWRPWAPWVAASAIAIVAACLAWFLVPRGAAESPKPDAAKVAVAAKPDAEAVANMVRIEPGYARIGNEPQRLRRFLESRLSGERLEDCLQMLSREAPNRVLVAGFWIDKYEVTNSEYAEFVAATGRAPPPLWQGPRPPTGQEQCPVTKVSYEDAEAYARWKGKRLPTLEQWMRAYRGDDERLFPWGEAYEAARANVGDNPRYNNTSPVTATPLDVSPLGVYNLLGNASEFVRGVGEVKGRTCRVVKGSEYKMPGFIWGLAPAHMSYAMDFIDEGTGFRCVVEDPPSK